MAAHKRKEVWDRAPPKKAKHTHLSSAKKSSAKAAAKRAGRPYPNLVDNIRAAKKKTTGKKIAGKKTSRKVTGRNKAVKTSATTKSASKKSAKR